MADEK
jgi:hypothetical protein